MSLQPLETLRSLFSAARYSDIVEFAASCHINADESPVEAMVVAAAYYKLGSFVEAEELLDKLQISLGNQIDFLSLYASTLRRLGKHQKAFQIFESALELDPNSIAVRNNYANLLIDLKHFQKARDMLSNVLLDSPGYPDAIINLKRLELLTSDIPSSAVHSASSTNDLKFSFYHDPLLLAFSSDEINHCAKRYFGKKDSSSSNDELKSLPDPSIDSLSDDQYSAIRIALSEKNYSFVLTLCSSLHSDNASDSRVYEYASDAYVGLHKFAEAEICLLHSLLLGGSSVKRLFNLVSFALMRSDFVKAELYLSKVAEMDNKSVGYKQLCDSVASKKAASNNVYTFVDSWSFSLDS